MSTPSDPLARFTYGTAPTSTKPEFLFSEPGARLPFPRCDSKTLYHLLEPDLAPFPLKEQSAAFYTAQCAHYGLPERKTKDPAKKTLLAAYEQQKGTLKVPSHIAAREKQVKLQYERELKKTVEQERKRADEERKQADKLEEMTRVRKKALQDLAKVNAFEKKLLGGAAGSSRPKTSVALKAATGKASASTTKKKAPAEKRNPARPDPTSPYNNASQPPPPPPPAKKRAANPSAHSHLHEREARPYASTSFVPASPPASAKPAARARPKQTGRRGKPMAGASAYHEEHKPAVSSRFHEEDVGRDYKPKREMFDFEPDEDELDDDMYYGGHYFAQVEDGLDEDVYYGTRCYAPEDRNLQLDIDYGGW